jgi:dihydroorotase
LHLQSRAEPAESRAEQQRAAADPEQPAEQQSREQSREQLVLLALEEAVDRGVISDDDITQEKLEQFLSRSGRRFYKLPEPAKGTKIVLERKEEIILKSIKSADGSVEVGNSRAGAKVWSLRWERV